MNNHNHTNQAQHSFNNDYLQDNNVKNHSFGNTSIPKPGYLFPKKGLRNIGSTCYMNATLQCSLHVIDLIVYFIDEYPKDKNTLDDINKNVSAKGNISNAFYNLVIGICDIGKKGNGKNNIKPKTNIGISGFNLFDSWTPFNSYNNSYGNSFSPDEFKRILGTYNLQFRRFEANDSKDLILYLQ